MVAVGFCSYWRLAVAAAAGSTAAAVAVSGYFYTTLGLSSLHCHGGVLGFANCHCFATSDPRKGRFAACGPKSMCVDAGLFPYLVLTSFWTSFFSFIRTHPAVYKLGKGPASRFCLWASTVPTKKGPLETGVPMGFDQKRIEHNRTMIVWSRLVKASVSNGERGFARSVPGQGSWRAFWLGIDVKRKHCKDLGVWV